MKTILIKTTILICFCTLFLNCKKEKIQTDDCQNTHVTLSEDIINGDLSVVENFYLSNDSLVFSSRSVSAVFFQDKASKTYTISPQTVYVGKVSLNGVQFNVVNGSSYCTYFDTTGTSFTTPYNWQIQGGNGHLAFNVAENMGFPIYANASNLPDTLTINQQDTINIGNYSGTSLTILVQSSIGSLGYITKTLEYPSSSIIILPHEYSDIGMMDGNATIFVLIDKSYYKPINGKMYKFKTRIAFYKPIYLKPV